MRRQTWAGWIVAAVVLAGFVLAPTAVPDTEATGASPAQNGMRDWELERGNGATLTTWSVGSAPFQLDPTMPSAALPFSIPEGAVHVLLNLTFVQGAGALVRVQFGECDLTFGPVVPGTGQSVSLDCGAILAGTENVLLTELTGILVGTAEVTALVCLHAQTRAPCQPPS